MLAAFLLILAASGIALPEIEAPMMVVFHQEDCPDCVRMEVVLEELLAAYPSVSISYYEIDQPGASDLLDQLSDAYRAFAVSLPIIFVGEEAIGGAGRAKELRLRRAVEDCARSECYSPLARAKEKLIYRHQLILVGAGIALFLLLSLVLGD